MFVTIAPPEGPLSITGLKLPDKVGDPPIAVVQNTSTKEIRDFVLEAVVGSGRTSLIDQDPRSALFLHAPGSAGFHWGQRVAVGPGFEWRQEDRVVPPSGTVEVHEITLSSHSLARFAGRLHSDCLHVTAYVKDVYFADGTVWESKLNTDQLREIWKSTFHSENASGCANPPVAEEVVNQIASYGIQSVGSPAPHPNAGVVQFYQVSCQLRMVEGKLAAICPW